MKRKEIRAVYEQGPEAVVNLVETLLAVIEKQAETVAKLSRLTERTAFLRTWSIRTITIFTYNIKNFL